MDPLSAGRDLEETKGEERVDEGGLGARLASLLSGDDSSLSIALKSALRRRSELRLGRRLGRLRHNDHSELTDARTTIGHRQRHLHNRDEGDEGGVRRSDIEKRYRVEELAIDDRIGSEGELLRVREREIALRSTG